MSKTGIHFCEIKVNKNNKQPDAQLRPGEKNTNTSSEMGIFML